MTTQHSSLELAAEVAAAWLSNPQTRAQADDASAMLASVHAAISGLAAPASSEVGEEQGSTSTSPATPAVSVRRSLASPEHIISLIDGKPYRSLTRHLTTHGLTAEEYRQRFGLKADYPMVAPAYRASRSEAAKRHNFGRIRPGTPEPAASPVAAEPPQKPKRKSAAQAKRDAQAHLGGGDTSSSATPPA